MGLSNRPGLQPAAAARGSGAEWRDARNDSSRKSEDGGNGPPVPVFASSSRLL